MSLGLVCRFVLCGLVDCPVVWFGVSCRVLSCRWVWFGLVSSGLVWFSDKWFGLVRCQVVWFGLVSSGLVWFSVKWFDLVQCLVVWFGMVWFGMVWLGMVWFGMVWLGLVWHGLVWYGLVWYGMVWFGLVNVAYYYRLLLSVQGLLVMTTCNAVTLITAVSMSAVSTNGQIKGNTLIRRRGRQVDIQGQKLAL